MKVSGDETRKDDKIIEIETREHHGDVGESWSQSLREVWDGDKLRETFHIHIL